MLVVKFDHAHHQKSYKDCCWIDRPLEWQNLTFLLRSFSLFSLLTLFWAPKGNIILSFVVEDLFSFTTQLQTSANHYLL